MRRVPLLALVPRRQEGEKQQLEDDKQQPKQRKKQNERHVTRQLSSKQQEQQEQQQQQELEAAADREEQRTRLGERFLRAMAQLSRLSRLQLGEDDDEGATTSATEMRRSTLSLASSLVMEKLKAEQQQQQQLTVMLPSPARPAALPRGNGGSPMKKEIVVVNEATAPLQELLTFEISMLLPPPLDKRQRALQSPLRRKRRRRRRRKKRVRCEWHASHATWVPHMATDYAEAQEAGAWKRSDVVKLSEQMRALDARRVDDCQVPRSISLPLLPKKIPGGSRRQERRIPSDEDSSSSEGTEEEDESESSSEGESEEETAKDDDAVDIKQDAQLGVSVAEIDTSESKDSCGRQGQEVDEDAARSNAAADERRRAMRQHRPAWISPELRAWLVASGLFATTSTGSNARNLAR